MQNYQDKQTYVNDLHGTKVRVLERRCEKQDDRIRELELAVTKLLKTVYGKHYIVPKYKFVLMNEGEKE